MAYQIRQLKLGGILDQAVTLTKNHLGPLFMIVGVTLLPVTLAASFAQMALLPALSFPFTLEEFQAFAVAQNKHAVLFNSLNVLTIVAAILSNAAIVHGIAATYLGKPVTTGAAIGRAFRTFFPLLWTSFLMGVAIMGGFILCVIPGIIAAFWFSLSTQVVVVEGISGLKALKRSRALMTGNIGTLFVLGLVMVPIIWGIQIGVLFVPQAQVRAVLAPLAQAVMTIFASAVTVVFYFSARCKHEQFDLQLLAENVGAEVVLESADENE